MACRRVLNLVRPLLLHRHAVPRDPRPFSPLRPPLSPLLQNLPLEREAKILTVLLDDLNLRTELVVCSGERIERDLYPPSLHSVARAWVLAICFPSSDTRTPRRRRTRRTRREKRPRTSERGRGSHKSHPLFTRRHSWKREKKGIMT